jgi:hypothetical protein
MAAAAIEAEPESIAETNAFVRMVVEIQRNDRRASDIPVPITVIPTLDRWAVTALRAMLFEPMRSWSIAKNVKLPHGRTFGELVTFVSPESDGAVPSRTTFFQALGLAVDEAMALPSGQGVTGA